MASSLHATKALLVAAFLVSSCDAQVELGTYRHNAAGGVAPITWPKPNAAPGGSAETYDANGNTLTSGGKTFAYDFENRLTAMNSGSVAVTLQYDADGNRIAKTVDGVTTRYLLDAVNPTGYPQVVEEVVNGVVQRTYSYGLQRISQNQLINGVWVRSFYGYDGAGSVRMLTDSTGAVTDTYDYDAFGNTINTTGSTPNVYLYRGEQYDPDLGLYYLRARYYNPVTGRFLTRDPDAGHIKTPATLHKYLYAGADPVNKADPTGRTTAAASEYYLLSQQMARAMPMVVATGFGLGCAAANYFTSVGLISPSQLGMFSACASGRQAKCELVDRDPDDQTGANKGGCRYACDDGTVWWTLYPCVNPLYKPWGEGFPVR
jgi:RHS repeat-associated protein